MTSETKPNVQKIQFILSISSQMQNFWMTVFYLKIQNQISFMALNLESSPHFNVKNNVFSADHNK